MDDFPMWLKVLIWLVLVCTVGYVLIMGVRLIG
jgi:hypothetical protein